MHTTKQAPCKIIKGSKVNTIISKSCKHPLLLLPQLVQKKQSGTGHNKSYTASGKGKVGQVWCSGVKDLLPRNNDALGLMGSTQVGIFKLASAYCQQLMGDNNALQQKLPTVAEQLKAIQMSKRPADIDTSLQTAVAEALVDNFHGEGLSVRPDAAAIKKRFG